MRQKRKHGQSLKRDEWRLWIVWAKKDGWSLRGIGRFLCDLTTFRHRGNLIKWSAQQVSDELKAAKNIYWDFDGLELSLADVPLHKKFVDCLEANTPDSWRAKFRQDMAVYRECAYEWGRRNGTNVAGRMGQHGTSLQLSVEQKGIAKRKDLILPERPKPFLQQAVESYFDFLSGIAAGLDQLMAKFIPDWEQGRKRQEQEEVRRFQEQDEARRAAKLIGKSRLEMEVEKYAGLSPAEQLRLWEQQQRKIEMDLRKRGRQSTSLKALRAVEERRKACDLE